MRGPASPAAAKKGTVSLFLPLLVVVSLLAGQVLLSGCANEWTNPEQIVFGIEHGGAAARSWATMRGDLAALPSNNPSSTDPFQVDLRGYDLSDLDLAGRQADLLMADFDSTTVWPPELPSPFDPALIMELGKSPGLELGRLHERGITGQGIGVAILDQALLATHVEYGERLRHYEERGVTSPGAEMHGAAVASIAVGKTVGVAPGASLYYIATNAPKVRGIAADAIERFLAMNRFLEPESRIRAISISVGLDPSSRLTRLVKEAAAQGVLVVSCGDSWRHGVAVRYHGLERDPLADPGLYRNYVLVEGWGFYRVSMSPAPPKTILLVPMNSRCVASQTGPSDYAFYRARGWSWCAPYIAGLYALGCEVDPDLDPQRFYDTAMATGHPLDVGALESGATAVIVDPVALIEALGGTPASGLSDAGGPAGPNEREVPASLYARMKVDLYYGNAPEELRDAGRVEAGQEVRVVSTEGDWTQVAAGDVQGWLPNWYLSETQEDLIGGVEPYFMFTKDSADLCLTPEVTGPPLRGVAPGSIVKVRAVWGDWAYVVIRVYDIPAVHRGWVPVLTLGTRSEVTPVEADLLAGTPVRFNDFSAPPDQASAGTVTSELTTYDMGVMLNSEVGPWTMVTAAGGWVAWVKTADLHYPDTGPGQ